jgi:biopolymer transport protein ExbD
MPVVTRDPQPMMEMNTTPLIDVMLVLLIMFIVTIPLQTDAIKIDLPGRSLPSDSVRNVLTIAPDGTARWNGIAALDADLVRTLAATQRMNPTPELHLRPDAEARYERVDEILAMTKRAQITRMGFVGNDAYQKF